MSFLVPDSSISLSLAVLLIFQIQPIVMNPESQKNVLGGRLQPCSVNPVTGWYRDGYCRTESRDHGVHTVCATMTSAFLEFTKARGNDLSTPNPYFPGLKPGDNWCLCASRWEEARRHGAAPRVVLEATNEATLSHGVQVESLHRHSQNSDDATRRLGRDNSNDDNSGSRDLCSPER